MRGEYPRKPRRPVSLRGSSPHAWGILIHQPVPLWRRRFIPTCVGNTTGFCVLKVAPLVHPHMRGEYICWAGAFGWPLGSSPHAWGIRRADAHLQRVGRFIPTCVGNTRRRSSASRRRAVHPHMRGEYRDAPRHHRASCGSSPHAWGIHRRPDRQRLPRRFIPTCVGNTAWPCGRRAPAPVHPHMRGEYMFQVLFRDSEAGSSPHAWGIPCPPFCRLPCLRFIPTCVGNTE